MRAVLIRFTIHIYAVTLELHVVTVLVVGWIKQQKCKPSRGPDGFTEKEFGDFSSW